ncbi:MAG: OmpH family outer membrane protein [Deltaproteobacteria bacterium]|nr:OmpH family outer membrane protein [Deltaproteobacteria bacterium]MBF0526358.1 OmpH family outer membrane protein [Deltaproteobacteria bacterium]
MNRHMIWLIAPLLLWLVVGRAEAAGQFKIGVIDLQECLNKSEAGKKAFSTLKTKKDKMQIQIDKRQADLDSIREQLEKQNTVMSPEAKRDRQKEFERKLRDFRDMVADFNDEMGKAEENKKREIFQDLVEKVINDYAKKNGFTLVMEKRTSGLLFADQAIDITNEIIELFNRSAGRSQQSKE